MSDHNIQKREAVDELAVQIRKLHAESETVQLSALDSITAAINSRVEVARLVEAAHASVGRGATFLAWWRSQDLPVGWATKYLKIASTANRRMLGDKNQLRLVGLLPEPEGATQGHRRAANPFEWTKWARKVREKLTPAVTGNMSTIDREVAMNQLAPLVAIYEKLKAEGKS